MAGVKPEDSQRKGEKGAFLRDTVRNGAGGLVLSAGRFIAMALIARTLGVEDFGTVALAIFCSELLTLICLVGLPGVVSRFVPVLTESDRIRFARLRLLWLLGAVTLMAALAPVLALELLGLDHGTALVFTMLVVSGALQTVVQAEIQGRLRFDLLVVSCLLGGVMLVSGAAGLSLFPTISAGLLVFFVAQTVQMLPWFALGKNFDQRAAFPAPLPCGREIAAYGLNVAAVSALTTIVWSRGELLVVEAALGGLTLGHYGAALTISALVWRMTGMLQGAVTPHLSRRLGDTAVLEGFVGDLNRLSMAVSSIVALGLAFFAAEIVVLVFGAAFAPAAPILVSIAPGLTVAGMLTVNLAVQMMSNGRVPRNAFLAGALLLLTLACVLAHAAGGLGAGVARSVAMVAVASAMPLWLIWQGSPGIGGKTLRELFVAVAILVASSALLLSVEMPLGLRAGLWLGLSYAVLVRATGALAPLTMARRTLGILRAL